MNKAGKTKDWQKFAMFSAIVALGYFAYQGGIFTAIGNGIAGYFATVSNEPIKTTSCTLLSSPSVTFKAFDAYNASPITVGFKYRPVGETSWSSGTTGTAVTLSALGDYEVMIANDNATYYSETFNWKVPCDLNPSKETKLSAIATYSSVSVVVTNADGSVNSDSVPQALGAGDVKNVKITISGQYKKEYGNDQILMTCNGTKSVLDEIDFAGLQSVSELNNLTKDSTYLYRSWIINDKLMSNTNEIKLTSSIDADDTTAPGTEDILCTLYDKSWNINEDTQKVESVFEDEDDLLVGCDGTKASFTIHTS